MIITVIPKSINKNVTPQQTVHPITLQHLNMHLS